jgi:hypothetical protein
LRLPQGTRSINLESSGTKYRTAPETYMYLRVSKFLFREGARKLEVAGEVKNLLQEQDASTIGSTVYNASNFLATDLLPEPRQLRLFARFMF